MDDRTLMLQVSRGSRSAFSVLVERHSGRLISFFYRQSGDRELAEDCTQEVFVRLFRSRERYGPTASFATFLYTIARNYWIDVVRARRVRPRETSLGSHGAEGTGDVLAWQALSTDPGPSESAQTTEQVGRLRRALGTLSEGQRDAVLLGVIEGLPYVDVAQILGVPVGTVKSRVHAAIQSLRRVLTPPGEPGTDQPRSRRLAHE